MSWVTGILVFIMVWWVLFFAILPWGVRPGVDTDKGQDGGAPVNPALVRKALITTVLAGLVFVLIYWLIEAGVLDRIVRPGSR